MKIGQHHRLREQLNLNWTSVIIISCTKPTYIEIGNMDEDGIEQISSDLCITILLFLASAEITFLQTPDHTQ